MRWSTAVILCLCVLVFGAAGTALGATKIKVTLRVAPDSTTLEDMTKKGDWLKFDLERAGPAQESFDAIGQPLAWGQARCLSLTYRASLQPTLWAVGVNVNNGHKDRYGWSELLHRDPAKTPLGNLVSIDELSESPIAATLAAVAQSCNIPLDV